MRFAVPDMSCGHCKAAIEKAMAAADPGAVLDFDMTARQVGVTSALAPEAVLKVLDAAGYKAEAA